VRDVEALKTRQYRSLMDETTQSFEALAKSDPDKAGRLLGTLLEVVEAAKRKHE
jgi:hypothetical protein